MDSEKKYSHTNFLKKLFGKMRGSYDRTRITAQNSSFSTILSECSSDATNTLLEDPDIDESLNYGRPNIEMRYGGQCLTVDQLPEFCNQLHQLLEVIRSIQSYSRVTGEYPSQLERRLDEEARELAALYAEVRNAREIITRTRVQRRAVRAERKEVVASLAALRDTEKRELENIVRVSDRKLYRSWETLKDTADEGAFEPLLDEIRGKQTALDSLLRLIENKRSNLIRQQSVPLPPPLPIHLNNEHKKSEILHRRINKRRRKAMRREARSVPLSNDSSLLIPEEPNVNASNSNRAGNINIITLSPDFPPIGSTTDIAFFTIS